MYAAWMWLLLDPELIQFACLPTEGKCYQNYYLAETYVRDFDRWMASFGNPWPVQQRVEGVRDRLVRQQQFWYAAWHANWCAKNNCLWQQLDWRGWLERTREIREGR